MIFAWMVISSGFHVETAFRDEVVGERRISNSTTLSKAFIENVSRLGSGGFHVETGHTSGGRRPVPAVGVEAPQGFGREGPIEHGGSRMAVLHIAPNLLNA